MHVPHVFPTQTFLNRRAPRYALDLVAKQLTSLPSLVTILAYSRPSSRRTLSWPGIRPYYYTLLFLMTMQGRQSRGSLLHACNIDGGR